ncbi:hypothetical protein ACOMHN_049174 [Nucella lapillus]
MQISVCDNPIVRANTNLQLPLINDATLRAWFKTRVTCLERQQLTQHLQMPVPAAPSMPIPLARQQPATLDEGQEDIRHEFKLPQNTAGTGKARRKRAAVKIQAAVPIAPSPSTSISMLCVPSAQPGSAPILFTLRQQILSMMERPAEQKPPPQPSTAGTSSMPAPSTPQPQAVSRKVSRTTAWRQRKRQQLEEELGVSMPRSRRKESTVCGQCHCPEIPGHGQCHGVWWIEIHGHGQCHGVWWIEIPGHGQCHGVWWIEIHGHGQCHGVWWIEIHGQCHGVWWIEIHGHGQCHGVWWIEIHGHGQCHGVWWIEIHGHVQCHGVWWIRPWPMSRGVVDRDPWPVSRGVVDRDPWPVSRGVVDRDPWPVSRGVVDRDPRPWPVSRGVDRDPWPVSRGVVDRDPWPWPVSRGNLPAEDVFKWTKMYNDTGNLGMSDLPFLIP